MEALREISRITTQKKSKQRYNIFLKTEHGDEYGFSVDESILVEYRLRKNMELEDAMIETLIQKDTLHKSYTQAINFLSYRMRTEKEISDYLAKKETEPEHIGHIIEKLKRERLIDDRLFSEMFVRSRISTTSKGPVLIKKELMDKGVAVQSAEQALKLYPENIQLEKIQKLIDKKLSLNKKEAYRKQLQKLQINLIQKGFAQGVIQEALSLMEEEKDEDSEWTAISYQGEKLLRKYEKKYEGFELRRKMSEALGRKGFSFDMIHRFLDEQLSREG